MSINYDFTDKVVLVTGSSSGIGAATAILFSKSGANVVVTGRNREKVAEVAKQCREISPKSLSALEVTADLTKDEDMMRLVETTIQKFGKLDILVNNAGAAMIANIINSDYMDKYKQIFKIDLDSVVYLTHICVPYLAKTNGTIINISSICSQQTTQNYSGYCMTKAAMDMFTKCMAVELGPQRIRVNSVNPGFTKTDICQGPVSIFCDIFAKQYPVGRYGEGLDIARAVCYLASNDSDFITGTIMVVDGGHLAANASLPELKNLAKDKYE